MIVLILVLVASSSSTLIYTYIDSSLSLSPHRGYCNCNAYTLYLFSCKETKWTI